MMYLFIIIRKYQIYFLKDQIFHLIQLEGQIMYGTSNRSKELSTSILRMLLPPLTSSYVPRCKFPSLQQ